MKKHMNPPCFITDPFKEDELIVSDTGEVMISEIQSCLHNLFEKYQNFS